MVRRNLAIFNASYSQNSGKTHFACDDHGYSIAGAVAVVFSFGRGEHQLHILKSTGEYENSIYV